MKYYDGNGVEYVVGDIVLNQSFGDYWVVQDVTEEDMKNYGLTTNLCLALYNSKNDYVIDIDEPAEFVIVMRKDDVEYNETINKLNEIAEERKEKSNET